MAKINEFINTKLFPVFILLSAIFIIYSIFWIPTIAAAPDTSLWELGYALLPEPQKVEIGEGRFKLGTNWKIKLLSSVTEQNIAVKTIVNRLSKECGIELTLQKNSFSSGNRVIQLEIRPGYTAKGIKEGLACQGYVLELKPDKITIFGNDNPGLFYGVQTLLQLLNSKTNLVLPVCKIEDWPDLELRIMHWCEKHHQNRIKNIKEYIDRAAKYKINAIGWQLEDKFAYERHLVIGAPGAYTKKQLREIDKYARERHIEIIPLIDCPAHMAYVLKHPEFAYLREDIDNNYMICPYKEESWDLLYDMFDEVMEAFTGKYFHISTDEAYFLGNGIECGCAEKKKQIGRSGIFVDFMNRAAKYLEERGKEVMFWGESPLKPSDIPKLPNTLIDAVAGQSSLDRNGELAIEQKHGMRVLIYYSTKGGEKIFIPDYLPFKYHDCSSRDHLNSMYERMFFARKVNNDVLGTFIAAWDDRGPHDEAFWLGWITGTSYAWHVGAPKPDKILPEFIRLFYGTEVVDMEEVYALLNDCALFWKFSWESKPSLMKPIVGNSYGIFPIPRPRMIESIRLPHLPDPNTLFNYPFWKDRYEKIYFRKDNRRGSPQSVLELRKEKELINRLINLLNENITIVIRNRYNLEIFLSLAKMFRHNVNLFETLAMIEETLSSTAENYLNFEHAVSCLEKAEKLAEDICKEREQTYQELKKTWEISRYPKGQSVDGRKFVHILDDTKNYPADVTPDLSYFILRERNLNIEKWINDLKGIRHNFVSRHKNK